MGGTMLPQARSGALVGRVLGGFVVRELLASGGFGAEPDDTSW
jgi:hypothetical protein